MRLACGVALVALVVTLSACGGSDHAATSLRRYVHEVEPIRLGVNELLDGADPILDAYNDHRITGEQAAVAMDGLEREFAKATVAINAVRPANERLAEIHRPYARTYFFEDAYLSALVSGLREGDFDALPNTQSAQRAAIIEWRTRLEIAARDAGVRLPADLQQAGRGEIAPAPSGS